MREKRGGPEAQPSGAPPHSLPYSLPVRRPSRFAHFGGFAVSLLAAALGLFLSFTAVLSASALIRALFVLSALCLAGLLGIFADALFGRLLSRGERLEVGEGSAILHARGGATRVDLTQNYELSLRRGEGDHKEQGGLLLVSLKQGATELKLAGEIGRGELPGELEALLAGAEEAPVLALIEEAARPDLRAVPGEGRILEVLSALRRAAPLA
jgi:hypothetical protein